MRSSSRASILYAAFDNVPSPKGASTHITHFVRALHGRYPSTTLISVNRSPCLEIGTYLGVPHIRIGFSEANFLRRVELFREFISRHIRDHRYHAVHFRSIWEGMPLLEFRDKGGYQTIYEVNGLPSLELPYHYPALKKSSSLLQRLRSQEIWTMRSSDLIITPSVLTANLISKAGVAEEKICLIPNGVDTDLFSPGESPGDEEPFVILYSGTLAPWQGIMTLLMAFREILDHGFARLLILGSGRKSWVREYMKAARKLKISEHVDFIPPVDHASVVDYIRKAHVCVAPLEASQRNIIQGCNPIKVLEYMACRKAIVATDLAVTRALLTHGEDSLLFSEGKADELARYLMDLKSDVNLRERLAGRAHEKVKAHYQWKSSCEKLLNAYDELFAARAGNEDAAGV
jgi:glycosyltransferase involved in cell wall biosynthesis